VWDALCRGWAESGLGWAALEAALDPSPISPPRTVDGGAANGRTLFVSGMFPSTAHGGGLRLFDIIHHFSRRSQIDLYSVYREDLDGPSLARLSPLLAAARLVRSDELAAADVEAWLRRLGRGGYDAVHFEYPQAAPLIPALRRHGRRSFFTLVECLTLAALIDVDRARTGAELAAAAVQFVRRYAVERSALDAAHHGIAVTAVDAAFAQRCFGAKPLLVPTCVSDEEIRRHLRPDTDPAGLSALFVGYYDHYPNVDALAWYLEGVHSRVAARLPGYRLRVVGRGNLSHLRARWGADARIDWVGPVDDLVPELQAARIGLAPVISGAGIRGKINQHAVAGRPTVSTSIGAFGLPYRHGESILVADSPAAFADAVADLLSDDALWRRLSARCRQLVDEHFSWSSALRPLEALHDA
jgi:glycosyltransferase involved in cell wall biosynthesis